MPTEERPKHGREQETGTHGGASMNAGKRGETDLDKDLANPQEHAEIGQQGGHKGATRLKELIATGKQDEEEKTGPNTP